MNKWQYLPRDLWFLKWKALGASSRLYASCDWDSITSPSDVFGRLQKFSDFFGRLRTSSGTFGNDRVVFKNPSTSRIKISRLYLRKSWQVYCRVNHNTKKSFQLILPVIRFVTTMRYSRWVAEIQTVDLINNVTKSVPWKRFYLYLLFSMNCRQVRYFQ